MDHYPEQKNIRPKISNLSLEDYANKNLPIEKFLDFKRKEESAKKKINIYVKDAEIKRQLEAIVPPNVLNQVFSQIKKTLQDEGGIVHIYDVDGNVMGKANNEYQAKLILMDLLKRDLANGVSQADRIGSQYSVVSLKKGVNNLPMLSSTLLSLTENLDLAKEDHRNIYYTVKDLQEKGFTSNDLEKTANELMNLKIKSNLDTLQLKKKSLKVKNYSLADIKQLEKYASKYL